MNTDRNTRLTLIQRMKDGDDEAAWSEFVTIYRNYLYVVVRNMKLSHHDAEEIVQTVFTKIWDKIKGFQYLPEKGKFRHWLCTITRNAVLDFLKSSKNKQQSLKVEAGDGQNPIDYETSLPEVEIMAEKEWFNYLANLALDMVTKDFSQDALQCFLLHAKGKAVKEIARELNLIENTVYVNCARIKERVKKKIKEIEGNIG